MSQPPDPSGRPPRVPLRKSTPESLEAALHSATEASHSASDGARRLLRWVWAAITLVVIVGAVLFWRQDRTNHRAAVAQHRADVAQIKLKCVTDYLQKSAENSLGFFVAEWNKVNGQYEGFAALRKASLSGNQKGAVAGFDGYLAATKAYRDGSVTRRLAFYGVTVVTEADGTKHLDTSHARAKAPCR